MPVIQLWLKSGKQSVQIPNEIPSTNFKLRSIETHMNRSNHAFYAGKVFLSFLPSNKCINNINANRAITFTVDPTSPFTEQKYDYDLGQFDIPRAFEAIVDLDSGLQTILKAQTTSTQPYAFVPNPLDINVKYDYINGTGAQNAGTNPYTCDYTSLGLLADVCTTTTSAYLDTTGKPTGPIPFLYSLIMTLEYDNPIL